MSRVQFALLSDENASPVPVLDRNGQPITFASEAEAERAIVLLALRRISGYFEGKLSFDDALHVPEYFVPITRNGKQSRSTPTS